MHRSIITLAMVIAIGLTSTLASAANTAAALETVIHKVDLQAVPWRDALEWLSLAAGFNLVVSWKNIEAQGIDPQTPVSMQLRGVRAQTVLRLMMEDIFGDTPVVAEATREYIHIRTKDQADADVVVRVYPIQDMLHEIPNFKDAPEFDLTQIAADDTSSGGSSIFEETDNDGEERLSRNDRANALADTIRQSVEPDIWRSNGGLHASITYYNGNLIISAPAYVHKKIGIPGIDSVVERSTPRASAVTAPSNSRRVNAGLPWYYGGYAGREYRKGYGVVGKSNGVSGIDWKQLHTR